MGLFGNNSDSENNEFSSISPQYQDSIKSIQKGLSAFSIQKNAANMKITNFEEKARIGYMDTLVQQNWIMIRQLDEISKKLDNIK